MSTKKLHTYIESTDIGDTVLCDYCNKEYGRDNPAKGGMLVGSYAVCPECVPKAEESARKYNEQKHIKARCPEGVTFHDWCIQLRGGNNTIKVITKEFK